MMFAESLLFWGCLASLAIFLFFFLGIFAADIRHSDINLNHPRPAAKQIGLSDTNGASAPAARHDASDTTARPLQTRSVD